MDWLSLLNVVSGVNKYSTVFSHIWLSVVIVFRILVFVVAVEDVWEDELQNFICDTTQIGCTNVCHDEFFPISHVRLWALQIIFVTCPSLMVVFHAKYREMKDEKYITLHKGDHLYVNPGKKRGGLWYTYILSLVLKAGFDAGFSYILYLKYHFNMPRIVKCSVQPCPNTVDCYISRSTEKKIFTLIMVVSSSVCIFMCICEIFYLINNKVCKFLRKRRDRITDYRRVNPTASSTQNLSNLHSVHVHRQHGKQRSGRTPVSVPPLA